MPWKETTMMEQKLEFINEWRSGNFNISELCRQFDISPPTAYKYLKRYEKEGLEGLKEKERTPHSHPRQTGEAIENQIVAHRKEHPRWSGEKIWKLLHKDFSEEEIPCVSTVNRIIKRYGLIRERRRRPRVKPVYPIFNPQGCNGVWSADFKGKFRMGNKLYCHPLTIAEAYSRYSVYGERVVWRLL
jgi:transposase-like protein